MTAPPSSTFESYSAVGNREDLSDTIYLVAATDCPFMQRAETTSADAILHE